jgi:hypothetical protein
VCLLGSAASTLLACFPTLFGKLLLVPCLAGATLRVVDFIMESCVSGIAPSRVAALAVTDRRMRYDGRTTCDWAQQGYRALWLAIT